MRRRDDETTRAIVGWCWDWESCSINAVTHAGANSVARSVQDLHCNNSHNFRMLLTLPEVGILPLSAYTKAAQCNKGDSEIVHKITARIHPCVQRCPCGVHPVYDSSTRDIMCLFPPSRLPSACLRSLHGRSVNSNLSLS